MSASCNLRRKLRWTHLAGFELQVIATLATLRYNLSSCLPKVDGEAFSHSAIPFAEIALGFGRPGARSARSHAVERPAPPKYLQSRLSRASERFFRASGGWFAFSNFLFSGSLYILLGAGRFFVGLGSFSCRDDEGTLEYALFRVPRVGGCVAEIRGT